MKYQNHPFNAASCNLASDVPMGVVTHSPHAVCLGQILKRLAAADFEVMHRKGDRANSSPLKSMFQSLEGSADRTRRKS